MIQPTNSLRSKYQELLDAAASGGVANLEVRQQDNVMYIDGEAPTDSVKQQLWDLYNKIDPEYRSGDLIMNINVTGGSTSATQEYTVEKGDSLSKIGEKYGVSWQEIFEANKDQVKNPDLIHPGWKLKIPGKK